jgi:hypothetical protein
MATPVPERETISIAPDGGPAEEQPAWRQDFPIDWPQDHYVERRDFVKFLTLTSLAASGRSVMWRSVHRSSSIIPSRMIRASWCDCRNRNSSRSDRSALTCHAP